MGHDGRFTIPTIQLFHTSLVWDPTHLKESSGYAFFPRPDLRRPRDLQRSRSAELSIARRGAAVPCHISRWFARLAPSHRTESEVGHQFGINLPGFCQVSMACQVFFRFVLDVNTYVCLGVQL